MFQTNIRSYKDLQINFPFTLFLPKRYYSKEKDRYLTFKEIFEIEKKVFTNGHYAHMVDEMNRLGVFFEETDAGAIQSFTKEVITYFNGTFKMEQQDRRLQERLWQTYIDANLNTYYSYKSPDEIYLKASPQFLRDNEWMLD